MQQQRINICIPCYNSEKFINKLFQMICKQTYDFLDVIFVNDGSTDRTKQLIEENIAKNKNKNICFFLYNQENKGIAYTRNNLISYCQNKYLIFIDHDDELFNDSIEVLYKEIINGDYDIVCGKTIMQWRSSVSLINLYQIRWKKNMTNKHYVKSNICLPWGAIFKKDVFNNLQFLEGYSFEDIGLLSYVYLKAKKFKFINKYVYIYCRRENSLSNFKKNNKWKLNDLYFQARYLFNFFKKEKWINTPEYRRSINGTLFQFFMPCILLSKYYCKNKKINLIVVSSFIKLFYDFEIKIKFSKTFFKSISFFYIIWSMRKAKKMLKNNKPVLKFNFKQITNIKSRVSNSIIELNKFYFSDIEKNAKANNLFTLQLDQLKKLDKQQLEKYAFGLKLKNKCEYLLISQDKYLDRLYYIDLTAYTDDIIEIINLINAYSYRIMFILEEKDYLNLKTNILNKWLIIIKPTRTRL